MRKFDRKDEARQNKITVLMGMVEKRLLLRAILLHKNNLAEAARWLNINRTDFYKRLKKHGIELGFKERRADMGWLALAKSNNEALRKFMGHLTNAT